MSVCVFVCVRARARVCVCVCAATANAHLQVRLYFGEMVNMQPLIQSSWIEIFFTTCLKMFRKPCLLLESQNPYNVAHRVGHHLRFK